MTGGGFVTGLLVPGARIPSDQGATAPPLHTERGATNTSAASALHAAREAGNPMSAPRDSSELLRAAWTIQAGFVRRWIFSFQTHSRETKWTRQFRNTNFIRAAIRKMTRC